MNRSSWRSLAVAGSIALGCMLLAILPKVATSEEFLNMMRFSRNPASKPAAEVLHRALARTDELARLHDGGWFYGDGIIPWDPADTAGYTGQRGPECVDGEMVYVVYIVGPGIEDTEAAVSVAVAHFEPQAYSVRNRFSMPSKHNSMSSVTLVSQDGSRLIYQPGTVLSTIAVESECTSDPFLLAVTPARFSTPPTVEPQPTD